MTLDFNVERFSRLSKSLKRFPEVIICFRLVENFLEFIIRYITLSSKGYPFQVRTRNDLVLQIKDFYDTTTAWVVFCKQEYNVTARHRLIVDLGANIGIFALFAARKSPDAKILCFEPFPSTFKRLEDNIEGNNLGDRIQCRQLAVSGSRQTRAMATGGFGSTSSHLLEPTTMDSSLVSVSCITFQDVLEEVERLYNSRTIDLLKIDIEGAEYELFDHVPLELLSQVQEVQMEYHFGGSKKALFDKLESADLICIVDYVLTEDSGIAHFKRKSDCFEY
jgi:FkbM family methyltransferase